MTEFLTLDQVDTWYRFYGVKVCPLGEDGDMGEVAFTHDRRRAIAAVRALRRSEGATVRGITVHNPSWWQVVDNCGCGDTCQCPKDDDGYGEHECDRYGLPPCEPEMYGWLGLDCKPDAPGALPVIKMEADLW